MNFREWAEEYLIERGVWPKDAPTIVTACIADKDSKSMDRWHDSVDDYPVAMRAVIALHLNRAALAWIDANCPLAWYRPMFDGTAAKLVAEKKRKDSSGS